MIPTEARMEILTGLRSLPIDADGTDVPYLPVPTHEGPLASRDVWVVVGARGMGKSTLARTLIGGRELTRYLEPLLAHGKLAAMDGWSKTGRAETPRRGEAPLDFWLRRLVEGLRQVQDGAGARPSVVRDASRRGELMERLYAVDQELAERKQPVLVVYDALESMEVVTEGRSEDFAAELLVLWAEVGPRLRQISPKIFLRADVRDRLVGRGADLAKLGPRTMTLTWSDHDIWRLMLFTFANSSPAALRWIVEGGFGGVTTGDRWEPPALVPERGPASCDAFATALAGALMGASAKKGFTYRWIPRALADGNGAIAPRSAVNLLRESAHDALQAPHLEGPLFTSENLRQGLRKTAQHRATELAEEHREVVEILERLQGSTVPIHGADLALRLFAGEHPVALRGRDASEVLDELARIGVLIQRADGRYDVPDLYRLAYGVKRRGGTALARRER